MGTQFESGKQGEKLWSRFRPKLGRDRPIMAAERGHRGRGHGGAAGELSIYNICETGINRKEKKNETKIKRKEAPCCFSGE